MKHIVLCAVYWSFLCHTFENQMGINSCGNIYTKLSIPHLCTISLCLRYLPVFYFYTVTPMAGFTFYNAFIDCNSLNQRLATLGATRIRKYILLVILGCFAFVFHLFLLFVIQHSIIIAYLQWVNYD